MASTTVRIRMLAGACLAFLTTTAYAQVAALAAGSTATGAGTSPRTPTLGNEGQIVVTGSRIARPDFAAPNPIVSYGADAIQKSGDTNVANFLLRVPALTNSLTNARTAGNAQADGAIGDAGLNLLDLRGLGTNRTLVLVNGRRHVATQIGTAAVDINTIPIDLIQRVDTLTGAVSAVYGADGVSGVVNFIMRRDFEGVQARTQNGLSSRGDAANHYASIVAGRNFADGRANLTLAYEYNSEQPLANDDRAYLRSARRLNFVNLNGYDPSRPGSYQQGPVPDIRYPGAYSYDGTLYAGGSYRGIVVINNQAFRGDGRPYTFGAPLVNDSYSLGGDDTPVAGYIGDILPRTRRHAANMLAHYDASDAFKLSVEGKFVQTSARTFSGFGGNYPATISLDNPFIPDTIRAAAVAAGLTSIDVARNNFDIPRRGEDDRRRTYRGVIDAAGRITDHASYDVSYTFGRTDIRATKLNDRLSEQFTQALDAIRDPATGRIVCRSVAARAAGCVPVNTFGENTVDPASFGYYLFDPVSRARIQQQVVSASLTGDFGDFFTLSGGPIQFALGAEYRKEQSRFRPAQELLDNVFYQYDEYVIPTPSKGSFDVKEIYGELNAPILKDRPFAYLLSVGAAGRYSHYSTIKGTKTYSFNGIYAPFEQVTFRGSYGQAVRAPNIAELFLPRTGISDFIDDPCYLGNRDAGTQYRGANCAALISAAGGNPATFTNANNPNASINIPGAQQGNPNLRAEVARTWTAGIVLRPIARLQVSADWYDIRIKGAINRATPTQVAQLCVDLPSVDNVFCQAINRLPGTGYINGYTVQPENVAEFRTAGLDLNVSYTVDTARLGRFDLRLVGGYLHKLQQIPLPGAVVDDQVNQPFRPKYNLAFSPTWTFGAFTLAYNLRWQDGTRRYARITTDDNPSYVDPRYFYFKDLWQSDAQLSWAAGERFTFYVGGTNLGDQRPSIGFATNVPVSPLGRYLYAGAKVNMGGGR